MVSGFDYSIVMLLTVLIKFLFIIFVVGLMGGLLVAAKNYIFTSEDMDNYKSKFKSKKTTINNACNICGKELDPEWKTCPYCSVTIEKENK